ncbi:hypothetical protein WOLCODRAFT_156874 [Wolfiporia cocos MD-104 SS10]|uniref:Uncharacterized protein n=1 Tax=Wolfiporia cocos (strain MD-104) TaxID=742152 RepID=A0A2H3JEN8_WOLCO|nr:hypothetical protein WOLCODRAFT_156874 [Wolfiporia cocos MD-104 SS10]
MTRNERVGHAYSGWGLVAYLLKTEVPGTGFVHASDGTLVALQEACASLTWIPHAPAASSSATGQDCSAPCEAQKYAASVKMRRGPARRRGRRGRGREARRRYLHYRATQAGAGIQSLLSGVLPLILVNAGVLDRASRELGWESSALNMLVLYK